VHTLHTSYTAAPVEKGRVYRFRCRVRNSIGWGAWSSPDSYIIAALSPAKPDPPRLVSATSTEITLQFATPADSGGSPLTLFELFVNDGDDANDATDPVVSYTSNAPQHVLTTAADGLETGKIYTFRYRATNSIGNSELSDAVRFALVDPPPAPAAPLLLVSQTQGSQIALEWPRVVLDAG